MIKSMTGYGRAREVRNKRDITVEVRSVNNRYLDCTVKMPRMYAFAEDAVKQRVQQAVSRGKVDVFITVDASAADVAKVTVNRELAGQYAAALGELAELCGPTAWKITPEQLSRFPDVLTVTKADEDLETVSADLCAVLDEALAAYTAMRAVEGEKLAEDIAGRLTQIEAYTAQVEARSPVSRGKVDVFITVDASAADVAKVTVNRELAGQYAAALGELAELCGPTAWKITPEQLSRFPDVLTVTKADEDLETVSADLCAVLDEALAAYTAMRAVEGEKLAEDIAGRLTQIEAYTAQVEARSPETVAEYRAKLTARMQEVLQSTSIDPQRILTEAAIYADKVAVDEETVRLRSHVAQLRTMLHADEPMGRKMDFLIQEVNRESNTIGSKCNDVAIAQVVVGLKAEVEKMREQVQNVE